MQIELLRDSGRIEFVAWNVLEFAEQDRRHVMELFHITADPLLNQAPLPFMHVELGRAIMDNRRILAVDFT